MDCKKQREFQRAYDHAEDLFAAGRYSEARDRFRDLILCRARPPAKLIADDLIVMERLADLSILCGQIDVADSALEAVELSAGKKIGRRGKQARLFTLAHDQARLKRAELALAKGSLENAQAHMRGLEYRTGPLAEIQVTPEGLNEWERSRFWDDFDEMDRRNSLSYFYLVCGRIKAGLGRYQHARTLYEQGRQQNSRLQPHLSILIIESLLEKGRLDECEELLEKQEKIRDGEEGLLLSTRALEVRGKIAMLRGNFGHAQEISERLLEHFTRSELPRARCKEALRLAHLQILLNKADIAAELLAFVLDLATTQQDAELAWNVQSLARLAGARGASMAPGFVIAPSLTELRELVETEESAETEANADEIQTETNPAPTPSPAPPFWKLSANFLENFERLSLTFQWYLSKGDHVEAKKCRDFLNTVFQGTDSSLVRARLNFLNGLYAYYLEFYEDADCKLAESMTTLQELGLGPELWQAMRVRSWCWKRSYRPLNDLLLLTRASDELLTWMTESLPDEADRVSFRANKWNAGEELLEGEVRELMRHVDLPDRVAWYLKPLARIKLQLQLNRILFLFDRDKPAFEDPTRPTSAEYSELRLLLRSLFYPRRRGRVSFLVLPAFTLVIWHHRGGWRFHLCRISRMRLQKLVRNWHRPDYAQRTARNLLAEGSVDREKQTTNTARIRARTARVLAHALQLPTIFDSMPKRVTALAISADDCLHLFPFAALPYQNGMLIERFALSYTYTTSTGRKRRKDRTSGATLVAAVTRGFAKEGYKQLDHAGPEARGVHAVFAQAKTYRSPGPFLDEEAGRTFLLDQLPRSGLFHIACHGVFVPDDPERSGLVLFQNYDRSEILSLRDIEMLDLGRLDHATLSSCWGADACLLPGRWAVSLPESFLRAGAGSVLACLWPVGDQAALDFMLSYYENLKSSPRDRALQATQMQFLNHPVEDWAGFHLYGRTESLSIKEVSS